MADGYKYLPAKVRRGIQYAVWRWDFQWFLKGDDDSFVHLPRLFKVLLETLTLIYTVYIYRNWIKYHLLERHGVDCTKNERMYIYIYCIYIYCIYVYVYIVVVGIKWGQKARGVNIIGIRNLDTRCSLHISLVLDTPSVMI